MTIKQLAVVGVAAVLAGLLGACSAGPGKYDVSVRPGETLRPGGRVRSFEVDLIGANKTEADRLQSCSVDSYFSGSDPVRRDAERKTLSFTADKPEPKVLAATDPIWKTWLAHGATELVVLANIPGATGGKGDDRRFLRLPLTTDRWKGRDIEIEVQQSGVICRTPMVPQK